MVYNFNFLSDNTDKYSNTSISIDNFSSIDSNLKQKLMRISTNNSMSITLEPIHISKAIKPSVNLLSNTLDESDLSVCVPPKLNQTLSSRTNNSCPSVILTHSFPSTSSCSMDNISQKSGSQYRQEPFANSKIPDKLPSNTAITKLNSSKYPEIKIPVVSKCISLARKTDTHGANYTSQHLTIDGDRNKDFKEEDSGFIFEITKQIALPNLLWKSVHYFAKNVTAFYQKDNDSKTNSKEIHFYNSLVPVIKIYGKKYEFNKLITSRNKLKILLEIINSIEKGPDDIDQIKLKTNIEDILKHLKSII